MRKLFLTVTFRNGDTEEYQADYKTILENIQLAASKNTPLILMTLDNKRICLFPGDIRSIEFTPIEEE